MSLRRRSRPRSGFCSNGSVVPFRAADRAEQHGVGRHAPSPSSRRSAARRARRGEQPPTRSSSTSKLSAAALAEPVDDALHLAHHFGADAVAGRISSFLIRGHVGSDPSRHARAAGHPRLRIESSSRGWSAGPAMTSEPAATSPQPGLRPWLRLEGCRSSASFCMGQADVVEAVQQAVLAERIDLEVHAPPSGA